MSRNVLRDSVRSYQTAVQRAIEALPVDAILQVADMILETHGRNGRIYVFGNGGSAAAASHMACDLGKNTLAEGLDHVNIQSLTDNSVLITALANDLGYESIFAGQLQQEHVGRRDLVIAISGSGNSPNVLRGVTLAKSAGARSVGITGFDGGALACIVDLALIVSSNCMEVIEDVHLIINHIITTGIRMVLQHQAEHLSTLIGSDKETALKVPNLAAPSSDMPLGKDNLFVMAPGEVPVSG